MTAAGEIPAPRRPDDNRATHALLSLLDRAACNPERLHEAGIDVGVFDAHSPRDPRAAVALAVCARCPVAVAECEEQLLTRGGNGTDGVRAGRIWRNGHEATGRRA